MISHCVCPWRLIGCDKKICVSYSKMIQSYVISLDDDTGKSRREAFYKECDYAGISRPIWVPGIRFDQETLEKNRHTITGLCTHTCSRGAIGCGLAHMSIYQKCRSFDTPIMIFEDDCRLSNGFKEKVRHALDGLMKTDPNFDILFLGCQSSCGKDTSAGVHKIESAQGAHAYIISPKGMAIMSDARLNDHIDIQMGDMAKAGKLRVYYAMPDIATASADEMNNSSNSPPVGFPNSLTYVLNRIYNEKGLPVSRHYTGEMRRIGPIDVTNFHFIFFFVGLVVGFNWTVVIFFALDAALFPTTKPLNTVSVIGAYCLGAIVNLKVLSWTSS